LVRCGARTGPSGFELVAELNGNVDHERITALLKHYRALKR
jgi:hypothetical protein